jgi:serine protease SohB
MGMLELSARVHAAHRLRSPVEFFTEYASFLAKTVTLVVAILVVLASFAALRSKGRRKSAGQLQVSKLNDFYKGLRERLEQTLLDKDQLKALRKSQAKPRKSRRKNRGQTPGVRAGFRRRHQGLGHREPAS